MQSREPVVRHYIGQRFGGRTAAGRGRTRGRAGSVALGLVLVFTATLVAGRGQEPRAHDSTPATDANTPLIDVPLAQIEPYAAPAPQREHRLEDAPEVKARYDAARAAFDNRQYAQAVAELDAALSFPQGSCFDVLYLMAQAKRALGRPGEARLAAEQALLYRPAAVDVHLLLGRLQREARRAAAACAHYRAATLAAEDPADNPRSMVAWYELGDALAEAGYLAAAVEAFERFERAVSAERPAPPEDDELTAILQRHPFGALERRVELLRRLDQPDKLVQAVAAARERQPDEPYLERLYVRALIDAGAAERAFAFCREQLGERVAAPDVPENERRVTDAPRVTMLLALTIEAGRAAGKLEEWVAELAQEVSEGRQAELARLLAERLDAVKDHHVSIPLWRGLATHQPDDADATWSLASAYKEAGDLATALDTLIAFVRGNGERVAIPPERLADWMRSFTATEDFLRRVREITARGDGDHATYTVLGMTAAAAGQADLAEQLFEAALEQRPDFALPRLAWGRMLLSAWRWEEALAQADAALAAVQSIAGDTRAIRAAAQLLRGDACVGLDRNAEAEQAYKAALEAQPHEPAAVMALARHYRRTGNLLGAQRYLQEAWSADPTQGEAIEELIDSYLEGGKNEIARKCLREAEASGVPDDVLRRVRTALRFAAAPMQPDHLAELTRQFEQHPDDVTTGLKLAAGLYITQRADEALPILLKVQARAPQDERLIYLLARVHLRRLENEQASALLEDLVRRYPRRRGALRLLADAQLADFRVEDARQTMRRMLEDCPADEDQEQRTALRTRLLESYLSFAEYDAALALLDEWLAQQPDVDELIQNKLQVLLMAERADAAVALAVARLEPVTQKFTEARTRLEELSAQLREQPKDADAQAQFENLQREYAARGTELYARRSEYVHVSVNAGQYEQAERRIREWLVDLPGEAQLQEWLIEVLLAAGRGEDALEAISALVPKTPTDVLKAFIWRARGLAAAGKRDDAVRDLNGLLEETFIRENAAARAQVREEILELLVRAREFDRAVAQCERWLSETSAVDGGGRGAAASAARLGVLLLKRYVLGAAERLEEQLEVSEELLAAQPHDAGLNNDIGYTYVERGERLERSLAMIKLAVAAEPLNAAYLDSLGWAHYRRGDFAAAREQLARAARLRVGQDATIFDHLGDAEWRLGDATAARAHWQKAQDLIEARPAAERSERDAQLLAALRGKLEAIEQSDTPVVAPTVAEQQAKETR